MSQSISERVLNAIAAQLAKVTTADGYRTDAGERVYRCKRDLQPTDLPCFVLWSPGESTEEGGGNHQSMDVRLQVLVIGYAAANADDTGSVVEGLKSDIKRALLSWAQKGGISDELGRLGELFYVGTEMQPRESGAAHEAVGANFTASYKERRGDPYTKP